MHFYFRSLSAHNWQNWKKKKKKKKVDSLHVPDIRLETCSWSINFQIYLKIMIFVKMWNLGEFREIWYFVNDCLIEDRI